jgi:hypothetical protein
MPINPINNSNVTVRVVLRPGSPPMVEESVPVVSSPQYRTRQQPTENPADPEATEGGDVRVRNPYPAARFQMGQRVKKIRNLRSNAPLNTVFVINQVIDTPTHSCPWAYSGSGLASGGVWEDELELDPTEARFAVGQRVRKYRALRNSGVRVGTEFTISSVLDMRSSGERAASSWAYVGPDCLLGCWEDELELVERLAAWEEELLRASTPPGEVGTTNNPPTKATFTLDQRVPITVVFDSGLRSLTGGRLAFDSHGEPYIFVKEGAWAGGVI